MGYQLSGMNAHARELLFDRIYSPFVLFQPIFYFLGLSAGEKMSSIGQPNTSTVFGGASLGKAQAQVDNHSARAEIAFVKTEPSAGETVSNVGGTTDVAGEFAEDNVGTTNFMWTVYNRAVKIRTQSLEDAQSAQAVDAVVEKAVKPILDSWLKGIAGDLRTGAPSVAEMLQPLWPNQMGVGTVLTANNTFGQIDRAVETQLNSLAIVAGTNTPTTAIDIDSNNTVNVGFTRSNDSAVVNGLAQTSENGIGCNLFLTTPTLWNSLRQQAGTQYQIHTSGIPGHSIAGARIPVIEKDNVWYAWDHGVTAGEMWCLNLDTWAIEIHRNHNFAFTGFRSKWLDEEGGAMYERGLYHAQLRMRCFQPWNQCRWTSLVA